MCGRYTLTQSGGTIRKELPFVGEAEAVQPRFNIAPAQAAPVIVSGQRLVLMRWGLVPSWAKDPTVGHRMINARSETVAVKPAFKASFQRRRCLVPADGFYEWKREGRARMPYYFRLQGHEIFAFAGLWDAWHSPDGSALQSFTILTTAANAVVQPVHHRMPVMLGPEQRRRWMEEEAITPAALAELASSPAQEALEAYPVDRMVNSPKNDQPECVRPVADPGEAGERQGTLL